MDSRATTGLPAAMAAATSGLTSRYLFIFIVIVPFLFSEEFEVRSEKLEIRSERNLIYTPHFALHTPNYYAILVFRANTDILGLMVSGDSKAMDPAARPALAVVSRSLPSRYAQTSAAIKASPQPVVFTM